MFSGYWIMKLDTVQFPSQCFMVWWCKTIKNHHFEISSKPFCLVLSSDKHETSKKNSNRWWMSPSSVSSMHRLLSLPWLPLPCPPQPSYFDKFKDKSRDKFMWMECWVEMLGGNPVPWSSMTTKHNNDLASKVLFCRFVQSRGVSRIFVLGFPSV